MSNPGDYEVYRNEEQGSAGAEVLHNALRLWRLVRRRQSLVLSVLAGCVVLGIAYYAVAPRSYRSTARLMIIQQSPDQVATVNEQSSSDNIMSTHRELIRSPVVVGAAIQQLRPEHRGDFEAEPPGKWIEELTKRLSASTVRKTNVLHIGYRSHDPESAAAVVNEIINAYLDFVEKHHGDTAAEVLAKLTSERDEKQQELSLKRQELQALRQQVGHLAVENADGVVDPTISRAIKLNESLIDTQRLRIEAQASLATVEAAIAQGQDIRQYLSLVEETVGREVLLATIGMSEQDQTTLAEQQSRLLTIRNELRRVSPHLGPRHPQVVALTEEARGLEEFLAGYHSGGDNRFSSLPAANMGPMLRSMLRQTITQTHQRELQLAASFQAARAEAARHSGSLVDLSMRGRDVERLEREVDVLFEKIAAVDIHQVQGPIKVTPVEEPLPSDESIWPDLRVVLFLSVLMGTALGVGFVYLQDLLDDRFGSPEEIALQLDLPVLAMIRKLALPPGDGLAGVPMHTDGTSPETEAFRTLRTSLTLNGNVTDRIAISSTEPSDGKTTVSSNLAVAFAQVGKRTLVIDADLRRPGMTALLDLKRKPGVTDILTTDGDIPTIAEKLICHTDEKGLDIIPAGPRRPNSPELLSGRNFSELLAWADSNYDQVLVDCPPVLAVSDAQLVGRMVDGVLVVISPEKNHRRLVTRACDSFRTAGVNVLGVVANNITDDNDKGYGYGYGYAYNYGSDPPPDSQALITDNDQDEPFADAGRQAA